MFNRQNQEDLQNQQLQLLKQIEMMESVVKPYLDRQAMTRYGTLKAAHQERAIQVLAILAQMIKTQQINHVLSDAEFKALLMQVNHLSKKENTMKFK